MDLIKLLEFVPILLQIGISIVEREATAKNMSVEELLASGEGDWKLAADEAADLKNLGHGE